LDGGLLGPSAVVYFASERAARVVASGGKEGAGEASPADGGDGRGGGEGSDEGEPACGARFDLPATLDRGAWRKIRDAVAASRRGASARANGTETSASTPIVVASGGGAAAAAAARRCASDLVTSGEAFVILVKGEVAVGDLKRANAASVAVLVAPRIASKGAGEGVR
jgi:hypothetical protein